MEKIVLNLKKLKSKVKVWIKKKVAEEKKDLILIESQILEILLQNLKTNLSVEDKVQLASLEYKKDKILKNEEEYWRLKSRVVWIEVGDSNTIFFHRYALNLKNKNTIWEINSSEGESLSSSRDIHNEVAKFFSNLYEDPGKVNICNQLVVSNHFPSFLSREEDEIIGRTINVEEIKESISSFFKDKSLGKDGWMTEFFLTFLDIMGIELLEVAETSRIEGVMFGAPKSTFIARVPEIQN